ncbi:MAG: hypothetical protein AAGC95_06040 [Pseudomonadota bacterium]
MIPLRTDVTPNKLRRMAERKRVGRRRNGVILPVDPCDGAFVWMTRSVHDALIVRSAK